PIEPDCIWAFGESGFQGADEGKERVIGPSGQHTVYEQQSGNKELTTVIVSICADGETALPAVIFKGKGYRTDCLGYSAKGWTDREMGVLWIKHFNEHTQAKANGRARLLLVDGHASHYTRGFFEYARAHNIHVLCYPSHSTHIYQGLNVVIFSRLKACWANEKAQWQWDHGEELSKQNFLAIYGRAHNRALTPELVKAAFWKTGMHPFNPDVVTDEVMAPSQETSCLAHLPVVQTSPVHVVSQLIRRITEPAPSSDPDAM
ncbi:DDE-domain-containing protein, partial [Leucogyrophana mollusca]